MPRHLITLALLLGCIAVSGCGNKGPLTLPDPASPVTDSTQSAEETE